MKKPDEKPQVSDKTLWQAIKFTLFSISAGVIQEGSFLLLYNAVFGMRLYSLC